MNNIVPEIDVLIASAIWLWKQRKVIPLQFSLAKGKGINLKSDEKRLRDELKAAGVPDTSNIRKELRISSPSQFLLSSGQDIKGIGFSPQEIWQIECKGAGSGKKSTQRNNFDRALASVVCYYTDDFQGFKTYLGLALPATSDYMSELRHRVGKPLRRQLNLWILLYNPNTKMICFVAPDGDYDNK